MDGYKQVGLILISNLRTTVEFDEGVGFAGVDHLHIRTILLYKPSEGQGKFQCQVLLLYLSQADGTSVTTAMPSVNHHRKVLIGSANR